MAARPPFFTARSVLEGRSPQRHAVERWGISGRYLFRDAALKLSLNDDTCRQARIAAQRAVSSDSKSPTSWPEAPVP